MKEGRINGNELKTELKKIHTQIIKLQKKQLGQKDKIAFAYYRISDLEQYSLINSCLVIEQVAVQSGMDPKMAELIKIYQPYDDTLFTKNALWDYWQWGDDQEVHTNQVFFDPEETYEDMKQVNAEIFRIKTGIFDFERPLCLTFNEFNYLPKIDTNLFTHDIRGGKTYEEYKNKLNDDPEEPWSKNGLLPSGIPVGNTTRIMRRTPRIFLVFTVCERQVYWNSVLMRFIDDLLALDLIVHFGFSDQRLEQTATFSI
ncbi:hypothetical protein Tco_0790202 [Tanacetum coccineum]